MPVHESIKRGDSPGCDAYIANYQRTVRNLGACGELARSGWTGKANDPTLARLDLAPRFRFTT